MSECVLCECVSVCDRVGVIPGKKASLTKEGTRATLEMLLCMSLLS